jgi:DNA-binding NarL/FixJ family response regulator
MTNYGGIVGETRKRIVLADDDTLLREGMASLLQGAGFDVVGQARDAAEVLALIREQHPDLVIMDIRMPPGYRTEGLDAARQIHAEFPAIAILVLSAHVEVEQAMELLAAGQGLGYLLKSRVVDVADFAETVGRIAAGGSVVDPALVQELVSARHRDATIQQLTSRERDVLALMAEGRSNAGIAHQLWITEGTVEKHVRGILARLRLPETEDDHRRVLAVLAYLESLTLSADDLASRAAENAEHSRRRQGLFGQKRGRRGVSDHVCEVRCGIAASWNARPPASLQEGWVLAAQTRARRIANMEGERIAPAPAIGEARVREARNMDTTPVSHTELFPPELVRLLDTARQVIDQHLNDCGTCAVCGLTWPCRSARLADFALAAL